MHLLRLRCKFVQDAESEEQQLRWFQQACVSFEKAGDTQLAMRARTQLGAAKLRWRVAAGAEPDMVAVALKVLACMHGGLWADARQLCGSVVPQLDERERMILSEQLVCRLNVGQDCRRLAPNTG